MVSIDLPDREHLAAVGRLPAKSSPEAVCLLPQPPPEDEAVQPETAHDLRHLGAPDRYLRAIIQKQISRVFFVPALTGTAVISVFYGMILYFNDGKISSGEISGIAACAGVIIAMSILIYLFYRMTLKRAWQAVKL
jgi:hypothetical protein